MSLAHVSLFSGVGGIDLAMARAGVPTIAACEIDKAARGVLNDRYPDTHLYTDVKDVTADDLRSLGCDPRRTVLSAGWPCQGNSVAGRRGGMGDERSGLWSEVVRILDEFRPAWFVGENVPGLLSVAGGWDFATVIGDLARLGYGFAWRILDAQSFGVPQRRRRVVIVGRLGDSGRTPAQILLEPEGLRGDLAASITPRPHPARPVARGVGASGVLGDVAHTLTAEGHDASEDGTGRGTPVVAFAGQTGGDVDMPVGEAVPTLGTSQVHSVAYVADVTSALDTNQGGADDNSAQGGQLVAFSTSVRRLTPKECERLQGFPDDHTATSWGKPQADSPRYKQMGNSVAVPVFEWVARRIVAIEEGAA